MPGSEARVHGFPILHVDSNNVTGSWKEWSQEFSLEMELQVLEMGTEKAAVDNEDGNRCETMVDRFTDKRKVLVLLIAIGQEGRNTLRSLGFDKDAQGASFHQAFQLLESHYKREESLYAKAQKFYNKWGGLPKKDQYGMICGIQ